MARPLHSTRRSDAVRRGAFTIIELLIVVAIVGVLIAALIPTIAGARRAGRAAVCVSNVGQIMTAMDLYLKENRDIYPSGETTYTDQSGNVKQAELTCWNLFGIKGIGEESNLDATNLDQTYRPLNTYLGQPERAQCPLDQGISESKLSNLLGGASLSGTANLYTVVGTSYAYAYRPPSERANAGEADESDIRDGLLWMGGEHSDRRSKIEQPASKLVVSDSLLSLDLPAYETENQWHNLVDRAPDAASQRQLEVTAGFADGHVAGVTRKGERDFANAYKDKSDPDLPIADVRKLMLPGPSGKTPEYY